MLLISISARKIKVSSILLTGTGSTQSTCLSMPPLFAHPAPSKHTVLPNTTGQPVREADTMTNTNKALWCLFSQIGKLYSNKIGLELVWRVTVNRSRWKLSFHFVQHNSLRGKQAIEALSTFDLMLNAASCAAHSQIEMEYVCRGK